MRKYIYTDTKFLK